MHIGIASLRQFQCVPTTYVTEIKETYFEIYTKQVPCPLAPPFLNISNCLSVLKYLSLYIANYLYLHDSYITKFDFMNYAFAKLVVAWLYQNFCCQLWIFFLKSRFSNNSSKDSTIMCKQVRSISGPMFHSA